MRVTDLAAETPTTDKPLPEIDHASADRMAAKMNGFLAKAFPNGVRS